MKERKNERKERKEGREPEEAENHPLRAAKLRIPTDACENPNVEPVDQIQSFQSKLPD